MCNNVNGKLKFFFPKRLTTFFARRYQRRFLLAKVLSTGRRLCAAAATPSKRLGNKNFFYLTLTFFSGNGAILYLKAVGNLEIVGELSEATTTQAKLARYLELSKPRITQLVEEKIVVRDESDAKGKILAFDSVRNYYLSQQSNDSGVNFWKEKGLHERAKRELAELKLKIQRGELYEASVVESVMIEHLTNFRTKLLGLPPKIAASLPAEIRGEVYDNLTREIENCLDELSKNYKEADLKSSVEIEVDEDE